VAGERLTGSDKRALWLWVIAGILGALFAYKYYFQAFPEASVNFKVSREEALRRAQSFVAGMAENTAAYQSAIVFDVDDNAKTYLEREVGLKQANQLMSSELNIWFWDVRFFRPLQEEEFRVRVNPAGQIVGYQHKVEERRAGAVLSQAAALAAAQNFASTKLGMNLGAWELLPEEVSASQKPSRLDWSFTWEKQGFRAKDAPYRMAVLVHGDRVGGSAEFLKVPEAWQRSYAQLRSTNLFYNEIAIIPYFLLLGSALWLGITLTRREQTTWGGAIKLGVVVALFYFLMQLNEWQATRFGYDTNNSYSGFVASRLVMALLQALGTAIMVTLVLPGAEPLYRASQPMRLRLSKAFTLRGLRSKEFFSSATVGLSLAAAHIGFIVAFYMFGSKAGVWAPQDLNYSETINTTFPWIAGIAIGLVASTSEEFLFRLFAVPFIERITKSRVLAVVLPAFSWSFLHSAYPQEPGYVRGIEVGLIGIVAGIVLLRWGIVATLIWHYTVDASLVGMLLIRSNSWYFKISGLVVGLAALAPLLFAAISYLSRGTFEQDADLLNAAKPVPEAALALPMAAATPQQVATRRYEALRPAPLLLLAVCVVLAFVTFGAGSAPHAIGNYLKLTLDANTGKLKADEILRQRGLDPASYRHATVFVDNTDPMVNEYLRERIGIDALNNIYASRVPGALWRVRYFRDRQPEEFDVILKPDGSLHSVWHVVSEEAPGASLSNEEAEARAAAFLQQNKQIDLSQWHVVESESDKRPHRVDHALMWEQKEPLNPTAGASTNTAEQAHARIRLQVLGDEVTKYQTFIKIPDDWVRKQQELNLPRLLVTYGIPALVYGIFGICVLIGFLKNLKSEDAQAVPWRRIGLWAVWAFLAFLVVFALGNRIPNFLMQYKTEVPFNFMVGGIALAVLVGGPFYFAAVALLFGLAWFYARRAFGEERIPGWLGMPALYYRDALCVGIGGTAGLLALSRLLQVAALHWPTAHRAAGASFGQDFDAFVPGASIVGSALLHSLFLTGLIAAVAAFVTDKVPQRWLRVVLFLGAACAFVGGSWGNSADFAKQYVAEFILLGVIVLGVRYIMRFNLLGCFLLLMLSAVIDAASKLLGQHGAFYRRNGLATLAALVVLLLWPLVAWLFPAPPPRGVNC
jgi:membrane protease YdiL (CAAX protease family)